LHFVFARNSRSVVEGPGGVVALDTLIEERLITPLVDDAFEIEMEAGLVYRTRRNGITVTAEIVPREQRLARPQRVRSITVFAALVATSLGFGTAATALAAPSGGWWSDSAAAAEANRAAILEHLDEKTRLLHGPYFAEPVTRDWASEERAANVVWYYEQTRASFCRRRHPSWQQGSCDCEFVVSSLTCYEPRGGWGERCRVDRRSGAVRCDSIQPPQF
jgi:hypothetical protein